MPFWSRRPAEPPSDPPARKPAFDWGHAVGEGSDDEGVLLGALADLLGFVEGADDDRLDPDAAVKIEESVAAQLGRLSDVGMTRIGDRLAALAGEEAARGAPGALVEILDALVDGLEPGADRDAVGDDARELDLAVIEVILALEGLEDDALDPDDAMKALELAAWHLSHLTRDGHAHFVASIASLATGVGRPGHADIAGSLADALDLAGSDERFEARNAEVPGPALVTRKRVIVTTPKGADQVRRQAEALRQNGYVGRWEVPDERQAGRAQRLLREVGVGTIGVRVIGR